MTSLADLGAGHQQLAALDPEGEAALDQVERVAAELLEPPPLEDGEPVAAAGGEQLQLLGSGDQARGDVALARADLEQELQEVGDQTALLAEAGSAILRSEERRVGKEGRSGGEVDRLVESSW